MLMIGKLYYSQRDMQCISSSAGRLLLYGVGISCFGGQTRATAYFSKIGNCVSSTNTAAQQVDKAGYGSGLGTLELGYAIDLNNITVLLTIFERCTAVI